MYTCSCAGMILYWDMVAQLRSTVVRLFFFIETMASLKGMVIPHADHKDKSWFSDKK